MNKVNGLFQTEAITYPRSGHHLLVRILQGYFGDRLHYVEIYETPPARHMDQCPEVNLQKNHDFDLATPIRDDRQYLVQVRHPLHSLTSYYELLRADGFIKGDDRASWAAHMSDKLDYWTGFVKKWIVPDIPNRLVVCYEDLISRPFRISARVVSFLTGNQEVDAEKLHDAVVKAKVFGNPGRPPMFYQRA